jgi:hypothetical protein
MPLYAGAAHVAAGFGLYQLVPFGTFRSCLLRSAKVVVDSWSVKKLSAFEVKSPAMNASA